MAEHKDEAELSVDDLRRLILSVYGKPGTSEGDFGPLRQRIMASGGLRDHFFQLASANPPGIKDPRDPDAPPKQTFYQHTYLERTGDKGVARLSETPYLLYAAPQSTLATDQNSADLVERVTNEGWRQAEERLEGLFQELLGEGQVRLAFGVLKSVMLPLPGPPDYEELAELPDDLEFDDARTRARKRDIRRRFEAEKRNGRHRETEESRQERHTVAKARLGWPWEMTVLGPENFAFLPNSRSPNGMSKAIEYYRVRLHDYAEELKDEGISLTATGSSGKLSLMIARQGTQVPASEEWQQETTDDNTYSRTVYQVRVWTMRRWYELVSADGDKWQLVKSARQPYGHPPFAVAFGKVYADHEMHLRYRPLLDALANVKVYEDRARAIADIVMEEHARREVMLARRDGVSPLTEEGQPEELQRNEAGIIEAPAGTTPVPIGAEMTTAIPQMLELIRKDREDAMPSTGDVDATGSTAPWTLKQLQQLANREPSMLIRHQLKAMRIIAEMQRRVMALPAEEGGFGQAIAVYARDAETGRTSGEILTADPDDFARVASMEVVIPTRSRAEAITDLQMLMQLYNNPSGRMATRREVIEEGRSKPNASDILYDLDAEALFERKIRPTLDETLMAVYGRRHVMTSDGGWLNMAGQPATPQDVLRANGVTPQARQTMPPPAGAQQPPPSIADATLQPTAPLVAPGTVPEPGMVG